MPATLDDVVAVLARLNDTADATHALLSDRLKMSEAEAEERRKGREVTFDDGTTPTQ